MGPIKDQCPYEKRSGHRQTQRKDPVKIPKGRPPPTSQRERPLEESKPFILDFHSQNCVSIVQASQPLLLCYGKKTKTRKLIHGEL